MEHCQLSSQREGKFQKPCPGCGSGLEGSEVAHSYTQAQEEGRVTLPCALNEESGESFMNMGSAPEESYKACRGDARGSGSGGKTVAFGLTKV